ncbi:MAG TPA: response regulator [Spirochaetota bacterium]|nr:response regulator [Spirochaetota bacterium]
MDKTVILVVDDEPDIRSELQMFLTEKGYEVVTASNGTEALEVYKKIKPDIVLSDYRMPLMNGFELMLKIKAVNKRAAIILMSAIMDLDRFVMTKKSSAYEFIPKPMDLAELLIIIEKLAAES